MARPAAPQKPGESNEAYQKRLLTNKQRTQQRQRQQDAAKERQAAENKKKEHRNAQYRESKRRNYVPANAMSSKTPHNRRSSSPPRDRTASSAPVPKSALKPSKTPTTKKKSVLIKTPSPTSSCSTPSSDTVSPTFPIRREIKEVELKLNSSKKMEKIQQNKKVVRQASAKDFYDANKETAGNVTEKAMKGTKETAAGMMKETKETAAEMMKETKETATTVASETMKEAAKENKNIYDTCTRELDEFTVAEQEEVEKQAALELQKWDLEEKLRRSSMKKKKKETNNISMGGDAKIRQNLFAEVDDTAKGTLDSPVKKGSPRKPPSTPSFANRVSFGYFGTPGESGTTPVPAPKLKDPPQASKKVLIVIQNRCGDEGLQFQVSSDAWDNKRTNPGFMVKLPSGKFQIGNITAESKMENGSEVVVELVHQDGTLHEHMLIVPNNGGKLHVLPCEFGFTVGDKVEYSNSNTRCCIIAYQVSLKDNKDGDAEPAPAYLLSSELGDYTKPIFAEEKDLTLLAKNSKSQSSTEVPSKDPPPQAQKKSGTEARAKKSSTTPTASKSCTEVPDKGLESSNESDYESLGTDESIEYKFVVGQSVVHLRDVEVAVVLNDGLKKNQQPFYKIGLLKNSRLTTKIVPEEDLQDKTTYMIDDMDIRDMRRGTWTQPKLKDFIRANYSDRNGHFYQPPTSCTTKAALKDWAMDGFEDFELISLKQAIRGDKQLWNQLGRPKDFLKKVPDSDFCHAG